MIPGSEYSCLEICLWHYLEIAVALDLPKKESYSLSRYFQQFSKNFICDNSIEQFHPNTGNWKTRYLNGDILWLKEYIDAQALAKIITITILLSDKWVNNSS